MRGRGKTAVREDEEKRWRGREGDGNGSEGGRATKTMQREIEGEITSGTLRGSASAMETRLNAGEGV
ncbi:hypothetical protein ACOSQ2_031700 [Xanthoceras sorbifolium]